MKKRILCVIFAVLLALCTVGLPAGAETEPVALTEPPQTAIAGGAANALTPDIASAVLMEASTGTVLFEHNADTPLPPASVTKIMTLLLVTEAIEAGQYGYDDLVTVSAHAASMGGSQVYLKEGETMRVEEMIKCVVISSANDCAVALAEHTAGSEAAFVERMNARAAELGMCNTHFENTNGLDDTVTDHVTSARDIALMSRALISHSKILSYSGIWTDTIRDGAFGLTNTNRLVRFYKGCTGLKTGSTARAGFCVSATAEREGVSLICVIMGAKTRDSRNTAAAKLLDYGFANYATYRAEEEALTRPVTGGVSLTSRLARAPFSAVIPKGAARAVTETLTLDDTLRAPLAAGEAVGYAIFTLDGNEIGRVPVTVCEEVKKMDFRTLFVRLLAKFLTM